MITQPPAQMRASVLTAPRQIELRTVDVPPVGPDQVLIRVEAVGVCGSDTHFFDEGKIGDIVVRGPVILGHESSGTIVAVGENVSADRIGARVAVEPQTVCRACAYCKRGDYHLCRAVAFYGAWPHDGSFADYEVIDDDFAHSLPAHVTFVQGALAEPVSVAIHAVRRAGISGASRVLVTGAGPIGILVAQVARAFGATHVVVSDPVSHRRGIAAASGATRVIAPTAVTDGEFDQYFDAYIDASGSARAIVPAFAAIRPGGCAVLVGMGGDHLEVPISLIQHREITVTGTFRYANTWPEALDLIASGRVVVDRLVTGRFGLHEVEAALTMGRTDAAAIKSVVIPELTQPR